MRAMALVAMVGMGVPMVGSRVALLLLLHTGFSMEGAWLDLEGLAGWPAAAVFLSVGKGAAGWDFVALVILGAGEACL